jgi:signal transduction histidine kinase/CheY-like chemotaxis protein
MTEPEPVSTGEPFSGSTAELAYLAGQLGTARNLLGVFRALRVYIGAVTGNSGLFVSLLDPSQQLRRCVYAWSDGVEVDVNQLPELPVSGSSSPHARTVATGNVVVATNLQTALTESPNVALGYERDPRAPNVSIAVPLAVLGRVIGGFEVQIIEHAEPASCVPSLQVAANLAAAAIENVRLIENERELRRAAESSEQRYRNGEQRLRLALEAAGLGTWEWAVGACELTWSSGARALVADLPNSLDEFLEMVYAEDRGRLAETFDAALAEAGTREVEFRVEHEPGKQRWFTCRIHSVVDGGRTPLRLLGVMLDITTRKETEQQREALARSQQLRAIGQMASGVAHDLNQALALISGYGELARDALNVSTPDVGDVSRMLDVMVRSAQDGADTLRQLLAFSRTTQPEILETIDMGTLLHEAAQLTAPRWRSAAPAARAIRLEVEVPVDTPMPVRASAAALREAITNLIFNAVDALAEGGTICLRGSLVGSRVLVEVVDDGPGIPEDLQLRIFEPFFTTKGERGTGLGLAQVKGVVARHGGELSVESASGQGTIFRILLPRSETTRAPSREQQADTGQISIGRRVLAADDEPKLRSMIARILEPDGHQLALASSGEEALEIMQREGPFDLVLTDISMGPGMSGWDLAERIHERWPDIPIVLSSGWGAQIDLDQARERGVADVIAKPFRLTALRDMVRRMTASSLNA